MSNSIVSIPKAVNEPIYSFAPNSPERALLQAALKEAKSKIKDIPMVINGRNVRTVNKVEIHPPAELKHLLGHYHLGDVSHVEKAIDAALKAKAQWEEFSWEKRAAIFLKAADLLAGPYRYKMLAATMLCQSKSAHQAEIDCICEMVDFLRFNVQYMQEIYRNQPESSPGVWNRVEYRALEGFVFALTPFNFTAIAGNLPTSCAMMGNTVVWKPAFSQIYSAALLMEIFQKAGLPDGVINLIFTPGAATGDTIFHHRDFAGIHFTGSTDTFQNIWQTIGNNIHKYKSYPRIVGETGGKDFVIAHPSARVEEVATALVRGAFEYQGQKCSAASRAYLPKSKADRIIELIQKDLATIKMGPTDDFSCFFNAVIDEKSYTKISNYITKAKRDKKVKIVAGGNFSKKDGYFIEPTVLVTTDPKYTTMCEEIFGPVLTIYVYADEKWEQTLDLLDSTSSYALTGAVFSQDRYALDIAMTKLRHAAGNFYINDKPTGAVVGQQPFGGARASGTNDKAGSYINLLRWTSLRTIKETLVAPTDYRYPFLG